jgi:K+-transporting ATPase ATPase A chain
MNAVVLEAALVALSLLPLGGYMARVFMGERTFLSPVIAPIESALYKCAGSIRSARWLEILRPRVLGFSVVGFAYLYTLLRTQAYLPLNPQHFGNLAPDLAWNTAISFLTNTNWQFYSGESTLSYLTQMAGLAWHMFVSAGAGIAIAVAVIRGFVRTDRKTLGNFWVDLTRSMLYVLVPISIVGGCSLLAGRAAELLAVRRRQEPRGLRATITGGPMASHGIDQGTRHERRRLRRRELDLAERKPDAVHRTSSNCSDAADPGGAHVHVRPVREGSASRLGALHRDVARVGGGFFRVRAEAAGNPIVHAMGVSGGNMEGKDVRFGIGASRCSR